MVNKPFSPTNTETTHRRPLERAKARKSTGDAGEYDTLYQRIISEQSKEAADALFDAHTQELAGSWRPEETGNP